MTTIRTARRYSSGDVELKESRPAKDISIKRGVLDYYIDVYLSQCTTEMLIKGHTPEIKILKNLACRYQTADAILSELDADLLISVIQMNLDERVYRVPTYFQDTIFDCMIKDLKLETVVTRPKYFNVQDLL